jgi:hypothetical protein
MLTSANQGIVINKKLSYCKDRDNQGHVNQALTVCVCLTSTTYVAFDTVLHTTVGPTNVYK